eukprot:6173055-Pleurochrysis_carterae.AAC.3
MLSQTRYVCAQKQHFIDARSHSNEQQSARGRSDRSNQPVQPIVQRVRRFAKSQSAIATASAALVSSGRVRVGGLIAASVCSCQKHNAWKQTTRSRTGTLRL